MQPSQPVQQAFELRFVSLFNEGRAVSFPCDSRGEVDLNNLSDRARASYFAARHAVGREYRCPTVVPTLRC